MKLSPCLCACREGAAERSVTLEAAAPEVIAALDHPARPVLACSASGRSISVVWPELRAYAVYNLAPSGTWEAVDRGECVEWLRGGHVVRVPCRWWRCAVAVVRA
jgi:hypothetical protein